MCVLPNSFTPVLLPYYLQNMSFPNILWFFSFFFHWIGKNIPLFFCWLTAFISHVTLLYFTKDFFTTFSGFFPYHNSNRKKFVRIKSYAPQCAAFGWRAISIAAAVHKLLTRACARARLSQPYAIWLMHFLRPFHFSWLMFYLAALMAKEISPNGAKWRFRKCWIFVQI